MLAASTGPASAFLDKTRFVTHLGIAYFCFHHWVWRPYEQGAFASGAPHRVSTMVKGGVALLFAVHEVEVAKKIADRSSDPLLQKLDGGLATLTGSFAAVGQKLKSGHFNPDDLQALKGYTNAFGAQAAQNGANIKDVPVTVPGA